MSQSVSTVLPLPDIEQQFKDVGHVLEAKKKQRRQARQQQMILENKVGYFEKQQRQTSRSIEEQKRKLQYVMRVRQRQEDDRREKELQDYLNQQEQNRLRMQSQFERKTHQQHMKQANDRLNNRNQYIYESIKHKIDRDVSRKKQNMKQELQARKERFRDIERQKSDGKQRINNFKLEQTSQALSNYREKMHREETLRTSIQQNIQDLSHRQQELMGRLKQSQIQHQKLQATLERAYDVELDLLQSLISEKPKSRVGRRSTSSGKNDGKHSPMTTVRRQFRPSVSPQAKFMNITLNTFVPRKQVNPEQMPPRRRARSRLNQVIRHIEQQYKS